MNNARAVVAQSGSSAIELGANPFGFGPEVHDVALGLSLFGRDHPHHVVAFIGSKRSNVQAFDRSPRVRVLRSGSMYDELGFYVLAGQPKSSRDLIDEVRDGEAMGFGTTFISERYNKKEIAALSGAAGAVSETIRIQTAATNHNTRHAIVTAGYARTMQSLTGGRFVLGLGRGIPVLQDAYGIPHITTANSKTSPGSCAACSAAK